MSTTTTRSPRPKHAKTKAAKKARKAVAAYAVRTRETRAEVELASPDAVHVNEQVPIASMPRSAQLFAGKVLAAGGRVECTLATRPLDGVATVACVWALTPSGSRIRASWHLQGDAWKTHAALVDGVSVGVTAAAKALA